MLNAKKEKRWFKVYVSLNVQKDKRCEMEHAIINACTYKYKQNQGVVFVILNMI